MAFGRGEAVEQTSDSVPERVPSARRGFPEQRLRFGEGLFDGFKSGLQGGRYVKVGPAVLTACSMPATLSAAGLSRTTMSPGGRQGEKTCSAWAKKGPHYKAELDLR